MALLALLSALLISRKPISNVKRGFLYCGRHMHNIQQTPGVVIPENVPFV